MSRLKLYHIGVHMSVALWHHDHAPCFAAIIGDTEGTWISGESVFGISTDPVGEDPASIRKNLDRLAAESTFFREHCFIFAPGASAVGTFLTAHNRSKLHIVFAFLAVKLGSVHSPYSIVRAVKQ